MTPIRRPFAALKAALAAKGYDVVDGPRRGWHGQEEAEAKPLPVRRGTDRGEGSGEPKPAA